MMRKKGSVMMISLWVLTILVIFAVSLGHRAVINLRLTRYQRDRLKAKYLAKAAINKAIALSEKDNSIDSQTKDFDTIKECGVNLSGKEPEELFSQSWNNGIDGFKIGYKDTSGDFVFGMQDEERRININGTDLDTKNRILALLVAKNIEDAQKLTDIIVGWMKADNQIDIAKKEALKIPQELLAILEYFYQQKGVNDYQAQAQTTFDTVKDLITIYTDSKININTVSEGALEIFAAALAEGNEKNKVVSVVGEIIKLREEKDQPIKGSGDLKIEDTDTDSVNLFNKLVGEFIYKSAYLRIDALANVNRITKNISAIYNPNNNKILYWHEN